MFRPLPLSLTIALSPLVLRLCTFVMLLVCLTGCPSKSGQAEKGSVPTVSEVAIRVLVIGEVEDEELVARQWLAGSEQDVEIMVRSPQEILEFDRLRADVVLFPSWMLAEFVDRNMLMKLSGPQANYSESGETEEGETSSTFAMSDAEKAQGSCEGELFGLSLGISMPVIIGSDSLAEKLSGSEGALTWEEVLGARQPADPEEFNFRKADLDALLDRFLAVLATTTSKNPTFGILFELETMKPRLTEPEFVEAANILKQLARQPDGLIGLLSSHVRTWDWVTSNESAVVAIASPCEVTHAEVGTATAGKLLSVQSAGKNNAWNVGGGMLVALSDDCSQTRRATEMVYWFGRAETRSALAPIIKGLQSPSSVTGADSLAWNAQQRCSQGLSNGDMPREPALPRASDFRSALARELLLMIQERKPAEEALEAANSAWEKIVADSGLTLQFKYEQSLNITQ